jgi:ribosomal protein S12 methylthiotransferase accessory factor
VTAGAELASTRKGFRTGCHRLVTPEQTLQRLSPLLSRMGITRVANITGLDQIGIPVAVAIRPQARSLATSQGKGLDLAAAKASALMESIEAYHAERITRPLKLASLNELRTLHHLADVDALPKLSVSCFHHDLQILWIEGQDLLHDRPTWVPYEMVHANYTLPLPAGSGSFMMSTNGLASGNHVLEALSHGICEVIERDATSLWQLAGGAAQAQTRIDLATVDDPGCRDVIARYARAEVEVAAWETTSDTGVPSFYCTIAPRSPSPLSPLYPASGAGCHPAREVALLRALTEAAQTRVTQIAGSRDDVAPEHYRGSQDLEFGARVLATLRAPATARRFTDAPTFHGETFVEDVAWELQRLQAAGIAQVILVDLSRPDIGIPVVRVIIPGLEGIQDVPGYALGARARRRLAAGP